MTNQRCRLHISVRRLGVVALAPTGKASYSAFTAGEVLMGGVSRLPL